MNQQRTNNNKALTVRQKRKQKQKPRANQGPFRETYGQKPITISLCRFLLQPPSLQVKLRYNILQRLNSPGVDAASYGYNINGVYDVDPAVASTAVPGFAEWMAIYGSYQVMSTRAKLHVMNQVDEPVQVDIAFFDKSLAVNTYLPNKYGNAYSKQYALSPKGGMDKCSYDTTIDLEQLAGSLVYWGSVAQFQGTTFTNPTTVYQIQIGVNSIVGGVDVDCYVTGFLEFDMHLTNPLIKSS